MNLDKILIPTDFSEHAGYALNTAGLFAKRFKSELIIFHNSDLHEIYMQTEESQKSRYPESQKREREIKEKLADLSGNLARDGITCLTTYKAGDMITNLSTFIEEREIDLVVMGSHGASGWNEFMMGSNAQKVVRTSPAPVLIIKHPVSDLNFGKIFFISNFDAEALPAFKDLLSFSKKFDSSVKLIHIDVPGWFRDPGIVINSAIKHFQEIAGDEGVPCESIRLEGNEKEASINSLVEEDRPDLFVIPTHFKAHYIKLLNFSLVEALVNHQDIPVMTIRI